MMSRSSSSCSLSDEQDDTVSNKVVEEVEEVKDCGVGDKVSEGERSDRGE